MYAGVVLGTWSGVDRLVGRLGHFSIGHASQGGDRASALVVVVERVPNRPTDHPTTTPTPHAQAASQHSPAAATATMSAEEIAGAFMQHYYGTLDSNIAGLGPLYVSPGWLWWFVSWGDGVVHVACWGI